MPRSAVHVAIEPASVRVVVTIQLENADASTAAVATLAPALATAATASALLGVSVIASPQTTQRVVTTEPAVPSGGDGGGSTGAIAAALGAGAAALGVGALLYRRWRQRRKAARGTGLPPGGGLRGRASSGVMKATRVESASICRDEIATSQAEIELDAEQGAAGARQAAEGAQQGTGVEMAAQRAPAEVVAVQSAAATRDTTVATVAARTTAKAARARLPADPQGSWLSAATMRVSKVSEIVRVSKVELRPTTTDERRGRWGVPADPPPRASSASPASRMSQYDRRRSGHEAEPPVVTTGTERMSHSIDL